VTSKLRSAEPVSTSAPTSADRCPVCRSASVRVLDLTHRGQIISSDWLILSNAELRPCCCEDCGLVFESRGVRSFSHEFYDKIFRPKPMMRVYSHSTVQSRHEKAVELIGELLPMAPTGRLVEIGSGKGQFIKRFHEVYPRWQLVGLEPSVSFESLTRSIPDAETHRCGYEGYECVPASQDLIVALGVIEHVDNPLAMLRWAARALRPGGLCFIEAPNFENHPNDLFCADHLSKLTPLMLENLATRAGFAVEAMRTMGVPMYFALRATGTSGKAPPSAFAHNIEIARRNERIARSILAGVSEARATAIRHKESFGIFGLASAGLAAPFVLNFPPSDIAAFMDDNSETWGTEIYGRPVGGSELIRLNGIRHIALSLSPVYAPAVAARLRELGATVYGEH
jgi:SAM-dependent methyltransferase